MENKNLFIVGLIGLGLVACSQIPKQAYYNRGQPESLVDKSTEVVNLNITSPASIEEITSWINKDQPTRAELKCPESDTLCAETKTVLRQFSVPTHYTSSQDKKVTLIYERLQTRDCENRYIDNPINPYNLNHPTFGCTVAVNMAQMITNKHEITDPQLMGYSDATKAAQTASFYNAPAGFSPSKVDSDFQPIATQASVSTSSGSSGSIQR